MLQEVKVFTIDAMSSNSMKSPNPYSGIHETETAKCLDTMCLDPSCNQGGHMIVIALEGNGIRPSHLGNGFSIDAPMYTLNTIEHHCVCYAIDQQCGKTKCGYAEEVMPTLCPDSHGTPHAVCYSVDCRNLCINEEKSGTLQAKNQGGFSYNYLNPVLMENDE